MLSSLLDESLVSVRELDGSAGRFCLPPHQAIHCRPAAAVEEETNHSVRNPIICSIQRETNLQENNRNYSVVRLQWQISEKVANLMRNKINFRFQRSSEHCKRVAEEIDQVSISLLQDFYFSDPLELSAALFSYLFFAYTFLP